MGKDKISIEDIQHAKSHILSNDLQIDEAPFRLSFFPCQSAILCMHNTLCPQDGTQSYRLDSKNGFGNTVCVIEIYHKNLQIKTYQFIRKFTI